VTGGACRTPRLAGGELQLALFIRSTQRVRGNPAVLAVILPEARILSPPVFSPTSHCPLTTSHCLLFTAARGRTG
jgi:hypothetical protein